MENNNNNRDGKSSFFRRPSDMEKRETPDQASEPRKQESPRRPRTERRFDQPKRSEHPRKFEHAKKFEHARKPSEPKEKLPENILFGIHPVREAIEAGTEIEKLYIRRAGGELSPDDRNQVNALNLLRQQAEEAGIHMQEVPVEKLNRLARNGNHQGVVAVISAIKYKEMNELIEELSASIEEGNTPLVMVLDSVTDVRNFGAIARSAECAGADALIISAKNAAPVNAEAIKSSAGALTLIPVCRAGSLKGMIARLKDIGIQCVAATEKSDKLIYETDLAQPTAIIMGSEDRGVSRDILSLCDQQAGIPLAGRIESLNVSAAAAVILFEALRQRFEKN